MIKLLALDLDGTIVNEKLEISPRTLALLRHLIKNTEVKVVIATGRMHLSALHFANTIGIREPLITYQGAMIRELNGGAGESKLLQHTPIAVPLARDVLQLLIEEKFSANIYVNETLFTNHDNNHATYYARLAGVTPILQHDLMNALTGPVTKMMAIDDHRLDELLVLLRERFGSRLTVCRSRTNFCEIIDANASKWNAIKTLADQWGIEATDVMAIGDQENDLSMLSQAGVGVAMGNAPSHVQAVANYTTGTIAQDGAADAIERFILGHPPLAEHHPATHAALGD